MPRERIKHGLNENAGGSLACPLCHSHEVWVTRVRAHTHTLTASVDRVDDYVATQPLALIGAVLDCDLACGQGHGFGLVMRSTGGLTKIVTEWVEPDESSK